jgi:hypothetical protein
MQNNLQSSTIVVNAVKEFAMIVQGQKSLFPLGGGINQCEFVRNAVQMT